MESPSFYKFLMDLPSHQLGLPQGFTEKYPETIRRDMKLRIASGATWEVRVEKLEEEEEEEDDDCYLFTKGWTKFLQEMGLQRFGLLVFSYAGDSTFHVTVYGANTYESHSNFRFSQNPRFQMEMEMQMQIIPVEQGVKWGFIKKLKECTIFDERVHVPKKFAMATGLAKKEKVEVKDEEGVRWKVRITDRNRGKYCFSRGWRKFLVANSVKPYTIVVFEYVRVRDVVKVVVVEDKEKGEEMLARALPGGLMFL